MTGEPGLPAAVRWRLPLAWLVIAWETLWPALWPATALILVFLILAFFDLLPLLPGWLHAGVLIGFTALLGGIVWRRRSHLRLPDRRAALRRLEMASGLRHRPLSALDDRFAGAEDDRLGRLVWQAHRARLLASVRVVGLDAPRAGLARRDPFALRVALSLALLIALVSAGGDAGRLLLRALTPHFGAVLPVAAPLVDLWITPPAYTGLPPLYLDGRRAAKPIPVPVGSAVLAQIHLNAGDAPDAPPRLAFEHWSVPFKPLGAEDFQASLILRQSGRLGVSSEDTVLASYAVGIIPDRPPTVALRRPVAVTPHGALDIRFLARDDYGVTALRLDIWRVAPDGTELPGQPLRIDLPVPMPAAPRLDDGTFQDLTAHVWAGLPVALRLVATDAMGQTGDGPITRITLPERHFTQPVARAVIALRKRLTVAPQETELVAKVLSDLSVRPAFYRDDLVVFMALRAASRELLDGGDGATIAAVQAMLWHVATRIEDGAAADAESDLRQAQQALQKALEQGASDDEIARRMQAVQDALDRYLQAMQAKQGQGAQPPASAAEGPGRVVTQQQIEAMLRHIQDLARAGDRQAARAALQQFQSLLESLRFGSAEGGSGAGQQAMRDMGAIARQQQALHDRSILLNGRNAAPAAQAGAATAQDALRRELDDLRQKMNALGSGAPPLDAADQAMAGAAEALRQGDAGTAALRQNDALNALRQAARALAQQMARGPGGQSGGGNAGDPLGRGPLDQGGELDVTDPSGAQESRQILEELRRREGDGDRPQYERDYIDRLLRDF